MAFNKPKLTQDLKAWMDTGAANGYPVPLSGVPPLISIIRSFANEGEDMFGNKVIDYTGSILQSLLMTLVVPGTPLYAAIQFSTGFESDWSARTLGITFGPINMRNGISNIVTVPPPSSNSQPLFFSVFTQNYSDSLSAASALADAIDTTCKQSVSTLTYSQKIPPFFPITTITSSIS